MKIKHWWRAHKPSKRRLIQLYAALLFNANLKGFKTGVIYKGPVKNICTPGLNCYSCPGASGACPLGALQNALTTSGATVPYYVFGIIMLYGLLFGRWICGFLCPFGLIQDLIHKIKTPKIKKSRVTRVMSYLKYVIIALFVVALPLIYAGISKVPGFCKYICPAGTLEGGVGLLSNPANASYMAMLGDLFTWKFLILVLVVVGAVFFYRFFCRFLCPLGAIYGLFNKISFVGVKLDRSSCTDCGLCIGKCKMDVRHVGDHECINCGECLDVCPTGAIQWKGPKILLPPQAIGGDIPTKGAGAEDPAAVKAQEKAVRRTRIARGVTLAIMLVILAGALYYYNFVDGRPQKNPGATETGAMTDAQSTETTADSVGETQSVKPAPPVGNQVGNTCPGLDLSLYNHDGTFNPAENRGKVTVINFWGTWCGPCVDELPHFNEVASTYADRVTVLAVHTNFSSGGDDDPTVWIPKHYPNSNILFAADPDDGGDGEFYTMMGGSGVWPVTIILDADGVITFVRPGSVSHDLLVSEIEKALSE